MCSIRSDAQFYVHDSPPKQRVDLLFSSSVKTVAIGLVLEIVQVLFFV